MDRIFNSHYRKLSLSIGVSILIIFTMFPMFPMLSDSFNAQGLQMNPFKEYLNNPQMPVPVGIGSYGLYRTVDGYGHYTIETDRIIAKTTINSLQANVVQPSPNTPAYESYFKMESDKSMCRSGPEYWPSRGDIDDGANLQFNIMMQANTTTGGTQTIWLQDTARFNTQTMKVNIPHNIVANLTSKNAPNLAYGNGNPARGSNTYYEYEGSCYRYSLPLTIVYEVDVQKLSNNLVQVLFKNNGKTFDTVYLPIANVKSAHIVVTPKLTPNGIPYDAELVWVGYCCYQESYFTQMDSYLSMYYEGNDGKLHSFPSLFTFGTETAETASNLVVDKDKHGGHVVIGQNNNSFLEEMKREPTSQEQNTTNCCAQTDTTPISIPIWIKNNAKWWSQGTIDDSTFVSGVQYLIQNGIIQVPQTQSNSTGSQEIPKWVKNTAGWWANGQMSDDDFVNAVQYMISNGIIKVQ